ncbi:polysaccharide deacetylase family protein [Staphylococcus sp. SQ8-PEA]|uniref:Polysaccharide deacetylase family protein n=1 Tax=Staphylococcus marylandisciuri TaxID=2981529 RepID=A0ABT2QSP3_9STAP|nr:polysaccharide deacetylase family protein [Staphylococcus marylandisciuri]MCU5746989.1 polysaccharide deacetylase family protein [Staphylococcus marylandisciuri]
MMKKVLYFFVVLTLGLALISGCQQSTDKKNGHEEHNHSKANTRNEYAKSHHPKEKNLVTYKGEIKHVFFHPIIANPKKAFTGDKQSAKGNNDWMVTTSEFKKALKELHKRNYIIIDPHDAYALHSHPVKRKKLKLPKGKKPLILSIDDMNYYSYMRGHGYADRLTLNKDHQVVSETKDKEGHKSYSKSNDIVPILNDYVHKHPDFSFKGQKGVVALTGYEGVLGYRTNELHNKHYKHRKAQAKKVANAMKRDGWSFGSHSYGHINFEDSSYDQIVKDTRRWKDEVEPIIGKTDLFFFPHGAQDRGSESYKYLTDKEGFKYIAGVGPNNFTTVSKDDVYQDRVAIDGLNLYQFRSKLKGIVNPDKVYDKDDRKYFKGNKYYEQ